MNVCTWQVLAFFISFFHFTFRWFHYTKANLYYIFLPWNVSCRNETWLLFIKAISEENTELKRIPDFLPVNCGFRYFEVSQTLQNMSMLKLPKSYLLPYSMELNTVGTKRKQWCLLGAWKWWSIHPINDEENPLVVFSRYLWYTFGLATAFSMAPFCGPKEAMKGALWVPTNSHFSCDPKTLFMC